MPFKYFQVKIAGVEDVGMRDGELGGRFWTIRMIASDNNSVKFKLLNFSGNQLKIRLPWKNSTTPGKTVKFFTVNAFQLQP